MKYARLLSGNGLGLKRIETLTLARGMMAMKETVEHRVRTRTARS
jgi:hypothetical protein